MAIAGPVEMNGTLKIESDLLSCAEFAERHTAENIQSKMIEILREWPIENNVGIVVTDNASKIKRAGKELLQLRHWGCFAHTLNLITNKGLDQVKDIVAKIKYVVRLFKRSIVALNDLKHNQRIMDLPPLKLKMNVATRWNSTYDMIDRCRKLKKAIITTITTLKPPGEDVSALSLTNSEMCDEIIDILEAFALITVDVSSETIVTISTVAQYVILMRKHLTICMKKKLKTETKAMVDQMMQQITDRFGDIEGNEFVGQCIILDPRFKKFGFYNGW